MIRKLKFTALCITLLFLLCLLGIWIYGKIPPPLDWKQPEYKSSYSSLDWKTYHDVPLSALRPDAKIWWTRVFGGSNECNIQHNLLKEVSPPMPGFYSCLIVSSEVETTTVNSSEMFRQLFIPVNTPEKALVFVDIFLERWGSGSSSGDVVSISGGYLVRVRSSAFSSCGGTTYANDSIWFVGQDGNITLVARQKEPNSEYWCSLWDSIKHGRLAPDNSQMMNIMM